jgi:hypothetical protein
MLTANDLRIRIYLRSMTGAMGFDELKRCVIERMLDLEQQLKTDPELQYPKKFDLHPKEIKRRNKAAKL